VRGIVIALTLSVAVTATARADAPQAGLAPADGDFVLRDFQFRSGARLPELRLHYMTLGKLVRDSAGHAVNAVLILHGTGGDGHQFLRPQFSDVLFRPGGLLDPARYYIILADGIGHGRSSKPSDGLKGKFPEYGYADMVAAQHALVTAGLGVDHLRLILGTSMGCMHAFVWGETYPDAMDALLPLACLPVQIAGRNRMFRKMIIDAIRDDPAWDGGNYRSQPQAALRAAADLLLLAGTAPLVAQKALPNRDDADRFVEESIAHSMAGLDANDLLYQVSASRDYDPSGKLEAIAAAVTWINSADDFINPPELGIAQREAARLKRGKFVLIPAGENTHGHGTHTWAELWQSELAALLERSAHATR
jgi:homoserine O-acetyltransferase/O-succinyltransferase